MEFSEEFSKALLEVEAKDRARAKELKEKIKSTEEEINILLDNDDIDGLEQFNEYVALMNKKTELEEELGGIIFYDSEDVQW